MATSVLLVLKVALFVIMLSFSLAFFCLYLMADSDETDREHGEKRQGITCNKSPPLESNLGHCGYMVNVFPQGHQDGPGDFKHQTKQPILSLFSRGQSL